MLQYKVAKPEEFKAVAALMVAYNQDPAQRCLHSHDEHAAGVLATIEKWAAEDAILFVVGEDDAGVVTAVLGAEFDHELKEAWLWGPFAPGYQGDLAGWSAIVDQLFADLMRALPFVPQRLHAFLNEPNVSAAKAYKRWGFGHEKNAYLFVAERPLARVPVGESAVQWLIPAYEGAFIKLFDTVFPKTYTTGKQIAGALCGTKQTAVYVQDGVVLGFCYAIVGDGGEEGYIEFIGTAEAARRQGVGQALLRFCTDWLFYELGMPQIGLTTSDNNVQAQRLYLENGFKVRYTGLVYRRPRG